MDTKGEVGLFAIVEGCAVEALHILRNSNDYFTVTLTVYFYASLSWKEAAGEVRAFAPFLMIGIDKNMQTLLSDRRALGKD